MKKCFKLRIKGLVQGVGFRPFVYRLANNLSILGWVNNDTEGVNIEIECSSKELDVFIQRLKLEKPSQCKITSLEYIETPLKNYTNFQVKESDFASTHSASVLPDLATCPECVEEIFDPNNRRYLYPFTNCTNCGPRFSIIEALPYDRDNTTMKFFDMCPLCLEEYKNPNDRRFHAQPNACPKCGPQLELFDNQKKIHFYKHEAILEVVKQIKAGMIVALKGVGGFQLIVDAQNDEAIKSLRQRKQRPSKPLAVMFADLKMAQEYCLLSSFEKELLLSPQAPIVLSKKLKPLSQYLAPQNSYIGAILPYSPLHHILLHELKRPIVATSANLSEEPICIDNDEACKTLSNIVDYFLCHNRTIFRHVDDSVVKVMASKPIVLRRARGYAPEPFEVEGQLPEALCVGPHLKNTFAITKENKIILSQHIGDLDNSKSQAAFNKEINFFEKFYDVKPIVVVKDAHPDYYTSLFCQKRIEPKINLHHHEAHILACMAEHNIKGSFLGVAWDGTGLGWDKTIWGGEFFNYTPGNFSRVAWLRPFSLLGGDAAIKEPRKIALALIMDEFGDCDFLQNLSFQLTEIENLKRLLNKDLYSPLTSSIGRLCEGIASLLGLIHKNEFEAQGAQILEFEAEKDRHEDYYNFEYIIQGSACIVDWGPVITEILMDLKICKEISWIAGKFHRALAQMILAIAELQKQKTLVLGGGVFQNKVLLEYLLKIGEKSGHIIFFPQKFPPNDGGIALGQAYSLSLDLVAKK